APLRHPGAPGRSLLRPAGQPAGAGELPRAGGPPAGGAGLGGLDGRADAAGGGPGAAGVRPRRRPRPRAGGCLLVDRLSLPPRPAPLDDVEAPAADRTRPDLPRDRGERLQQRPARGRVGGPVPGDARAGPASRDGPSRGPAGTRAGGRRRACRSGPAGAVGGPGAGGAELGDADRRGGRLAARPGLTRSLFSAFRPQGAARVIPAVRPLSRRPTSAPSPGGAGGTSILPRARPRDSACSSPTAPRPRPTPSGRPGGARRPSAAVAPALLRPGGAARTPRRAATRLRL